jgi:endonuclease G, mitochondrial
MKLQDLSHIEETMLRAESIDSRSVIDVEEQLELRRERLAQSAVNETPNDAFERVIGKNDLLPVSYFAEGLRATKAICRVIINGRNGDYGTGFLVAPDLLITNNHVLPDAATAKMSIAEFDYELDEDSNPLLPARFALKPDVVFVTSDKKKLDYTLVAVESVSRKGQRKLSSFGFLPMIPTLGKATINEFVSIIQHPDGDYKQLAIRENKVTEFRNSTNGQPDFIIYETDTAPGSSGSPVLNDQWELVGLHHSGVPEKNENGEWLTIKGEIWHQGMSETLVKWKANEGIRVSAIVRDLQEQAPVEIVSRVLEAQNLSNEPKQNEGFSVVETADYEETNVTSDLVNSTLQPQSSSSTTMETPSFTFNVPLQITVSIGQISTTAPATETTAPKKVASNELAEKTNSIDPNYASRKGYNAKFLGNKFAIKLEDLLKNKTADLAPLKTSFQTTTNKNLLHYHNFSIGMHRKRKMCLVTAVNIEGKKSKAIKRTNDTWILDPRMETRFQTEPEVYKNNALDRGHMVRRLDPAWGTNALSANNDTFHYTNSCPQHGDLNQKTWNDLEDYILDSTKEEKLNVSVFTGPVFSEDDVPYRGVLLPLQFWKIAALVKSNGELSVSGYMLSQEEFLAGIGAEEAVRDTGFGQYKTYQVPLSKIATLTGLHLEPFYANDPMSALSPEESTATFREIGGEADLML